MRDIEKIVEQMTLEEKAGLCSGADFWHLKSIERLNIPRIMVADGPHGLRKQDENADHLGINDSIKAVCFPSAAGLASSFDRSLAQKVGETLGKECRAENVAVLLGPAINIKRSPLCGRNFEYLSEDPYLSGQLAAAYIQGVQSENIGTSVKHFVANNQEKRRSTVSAEISERAFREIYLAGFEEAVKEGRPWTVMCSYNRVNGEYVSQSHRILTEILREEWGFDGFVVTDWGACDERVKGLLAGQDLEMPDSGGVNDKLIVKAVEDGTLEETILDRAVARILNIIFRYVDAISEPEAFDREADHEIARQTACESMVLLKNKEQKDKRILPLQKGKNYAFIGKFAEQPRYQGGGSSHINASRISNALDSCRQYATITYAQGYELTDREVDEELIAEAVRVAKESDAAVLFAGLPEFMESEAYDREHMRLPLCQNILIEAVAEVQPNLVVVLNNGCPIEMPWAERVPAILECYLAGEAVGEAQADILFGIANPSGKLAETFPKRLQDNPSYLDFGGQSDIVHYGEGIFVGYRYYDIREMDVLFPFGHGLSYTEFKYDNLKLDKRNLTAEDTINIRFDLSNIGECSGKEAVQVYVRKKNSGISRADKELKGFEKVHLWKCETKEIEIVLDSRSFRYFNEDTGKWSIEQGEYEILIGASSRDIRLSATVQFSDSSATGWICHRNSTLGDIRSNPTAAAVLQEILKEEVGELPFSKLENQDTLGEGMSRMLAAIVNDSPLRALRSYLKGKADEAFIERIVDKINHAINNEMKS